MRQVISVQVGERYRMVQNTSMVCEVLESSATNVKARVLESMSKVLVGNVEDYDPKVFKAHFKKVDE